MRSRFSDLVGALALTGIVAGTALGQTTGGTPATPASAQTGTARAGTGGMRVRLTLKDADMIVATRSLTQQTGLQFIVEPSDVPYGRITLTLADQTPEDALAYICQAAGAYFRRDENGVFVISHRKPEVKAEPILKESGKVARLTRKIRLIHADPGVLYRQLAFAEVENPQTAVKALKRFQSLASMSNDEARYSDNPIVAGQANYSGSLFQGRASYPTAPANLPKILDRDGRPMSAGSPGNSSSGNDIALPGEEANQRGGGGGFAGGGGGQLGGGGGGGQLGGGGQGGGGQNGGQGGNVNLQGGQGLIPDTIDYISFDPTDNSIIVRGTSEDDINELQNTIATFDIAPQQVTIRVEFITTGDQLQKSLGYNVQYQRGAFIAGEVPSTFLDLSSSSFLTYATGNAVLRLRANLQESNSKLVTAPIIRTLNNQPATVFSFFTTFIFTTNQLLGGNGIASTTVNPIAIQTGTSLTVAPRINADGTITLALNPQVGGINGSQVSPDGTTIPNFVNSGVFCVVRVRNRETIVLGGLNTENIQYISNRVPVLSEIPIIGQFFKSTRTTKNNSELLIFVTPEINEDDPANINP